MQKTLLSNTIEFYRADRSHGFLSNLYKSEIKFKGKLFPTAEHAYQYGKFRDKDIADWVMTAPSAHFVAIIGHGLFAWDIVEDWTKIKVKRMKEIVHAKFKQHSELLKQLLETKNAILLEASSFDNFWGIGPKRKGKNMLGKILMKIREELRTENVVLKCPKGITNNPNYWNCSFCTHFSKITNTCMVYQEGADK